MTTRYSDTEIEARRASHLGRRLYNLMRQSDEALAGIPDAEDLSDSARGILVLAAHGVASGSVIGAVLGISKQAVSKQVADLLRHGLIRRRSDGADARYRIIEVAGRSRNAWLRERAAAIEADWVAKVGVAGVDFVRGRLAAVAQRPELDAAPLLVLAWHQASAFGLRTTQFIRKREFREITVAKILVVGSLPLTGDVPVATLVKRGFVSRQAMHVHLDDLVAARYVTKRVSPDDARVTSVQLTAKGKRMLAVAMDAIEAEEKAYEAALGSADFERLKRYLALMDSDLHLAAAHGQ